MSVIFPEELKKLILKNYPKKILKGVRIPMWVEGLGLDPYEHRQVCFKGSYIIFKKEGNKWKKMQGELSEGYWF